MYGPHQKGPRSRRQASARPADIATTVDGRDRRQRRRELGAAATARWMGAARATSCRLGTSVKKGHIVPQVFQRSFAIDERKGVLAQFLGLQMVRGPARKRDAASCTSAS